MKSVTQAIFFLIGIFIFCFLSLVLFFQVPPSKNHCDIDSSAYTQASRFLREDGSFKRIGKEPYYGLGYPLLLSLVQCLFGDSVAALIAIQVFLSLLLMLLAWRIASLLYSPIAAWIAYFTASMHVGFLVFAQFVLTETLLTLLLAVTVERILTFLQTQRRSSLCLAGFFLGLSCVVKAVGALFLPVLIGLVFITSSFNRRSFTNAAVLLVCFLIPMGAYKIHNKVFFQRNDISMVVMNVGYWFYPYLLAEMHHSSVAAEKLQLRAVAISAHDLMDNVRRDVCKHPFLVAKVLLRNWSKTLLGLYASNIKLLVDDTFTSGSLSFFDLQGSLWQKMKNYIEGKTSLSWIKYVGWTEAVLLLACYIFGLLGLYLLVRRAQWVAALFVVLYVGYFVGITGHDGCARFRMMIDVLLLALAAGGVEFVYSRNSKEEKETLS